jgi:hypothetical protein
MCFCGSAFNTGYDTCMSSKVDTNNSTDDPSHKHCRVVSYAQHWDLDDEHEHQGSHVFLPGGNLRLLEGLAQGLPIFYNAPARLLQYSSTGVSGMVAARC